MSDLIEVCPCGWSGTKSLLIPETYENETLVTCPKCNGVVYVEVTKEEFNRKWFEVVKSKSKADIANFCRKYRTRGIGK